MKAHYGFEFCDQSWVPRGARECLFEIMDALNSGLRSFNGQVARTVIALARDHQLGTIIELGAGRAPVTAELVKHDESSGLRLIACDLVPNENAYRKLAERFPDRVFPIYSSVDITQSQPALQQAVLVLAGVMHHIPFDLRPAVISALSRTDSITAVFEPLRRTWLSTSMAALSFFPALLLPLTFFSRPGKMRRFFWCWIVPIVPFMFAWDGVTSCRRQWTPEEWQRAFDRLPNPPKVEIRPGVNSLVMTWTGTSDV